MWGTADYGGANGAGTIFKFDPVSASVTPVYSFGAGSDAAYPPNDLIAEGGVLYGVTQYGGTNNTGTVYAYDTAKGTEAVLYSFGPFGGTDGYRPASQLFYRAGYVYGTAQAGGANNLGIIYRVNVKTGREDVLHNFSGKKDGASPYTGLTAGAAAALFIAASNNWETDLRRQTRRNVYLIVVVGLLCGLSKGQSSVLPVAAVIATAAAARQSKALLTWWEGHLERKRFPPDGLDNRA